MKVGDKVIMNEGGKIGTITKVEGDLFRVSFKLNRRNGFSQYFSASEIVLVKSI